MTSSAAASVTLTDGAGVMPKYWPSACPMPRDGSYATVWTSKACQKASSTSARGLKLLVYEALAASSSRVLYEN